MRLSCLLQEAQAAADAAVEVVWAAREGEMEEAWAAREQEDSARRLGLLRTGQGRQLDLRHLGR